MDNHDDPIAKIGIIGGGAAGMSCALWLKQLGCQPVIIEKNAYLGGQLKGMQRLNRWVLGHQQQTSSELAELYAAHIRQLDVDCFVETQLLNVTRLTDGFELIVCRDGKHINQIVRALVIATGVRVVGAEMFADTLGFAALYPSPQISFHPLDHLPKLAQLAGRTVAVIGSGDNAHFTAKDAALAGAQVYLIIRHSAKARPAIRHQVLALIAEGRIHEYSSVQIAAFNATKNTITLTLTNGQSLTVDHLFGRLGFAANTGFLDQFAALADIAKERGYIKTDTVYRSSLADVYAIGDVADALHPSVVNAIAAGAVAAQDLSDRI